MPGWELFDFHLLPFGIAVGVLASLVGVGGGAFMVPWLVLVYCGTTGFKPVPPVAASLSVVVLTALSSTAGNAPRGRIDYKVSLILALGTLPGAFLGPLLLPGVTPKAFLFGFAILLIVTAGYLCFFSPKAGGSRIGGTLRRITESDGAVHEYRFNYTVGILASVVAGFVATMGGVGGGIIHMPVLILLFGLPPHIASATSQLALLITASIGTSVYIVEGHFYPSAFVLLGAGVIIGAQIAVRIAKRISGPWLKRILAGVVLFVAIRMLWAALGTLPANGP